MEEPDILRGYASDADILIPSFEGLNSAEVLAPVLEFLPPPCSVLEVGAGTGRDSAWLAKRRYRVLAAEPVGEFRRAGMALHPSDGIRWVEDRLPALEKVSRLGETYGLILAVGVWQHLHPEDHPGSIRPLARLLSPKGRLILSLRHGPGAPTRTCYPADVERVIECASDEELSLLARRTAASVQAANRAAGVTWIWLCLERPT